MNKIDKALAFTLKWEGGYVDNPLDMGGITNYGISQRHYPNLDIKNLTLEKDALVPPNAPVNVPPVKGR